MTLKQDVARLQQKIRKIKQLSAKENNPNVSVGYTAQYAIYVHENLEADHKEGTQAKFLEQPYKELTNNGVLQSIIHRVTARTKSLEQGLLAAGNRLQRESQRIVPVDTGFLKSSAFTRLEK